MTNCQCFIGRDKFQERRCIRATLVKVNQRTVWVRLTNGDLVKRRIDRDHVVIDPGAQPEISSKVRE